MICQLCLLTSGSSMIFDSGDSRKKGSLKTECLNSRSPLCLGKCKNHPKWWFFLKSRWLSDDSMFSQRTWCFFWGKPHEDRQLRAHRVAWTQKPILLRCWKSWLSWRFLQVHLLRFQWYPDINLLYFCLHIWIPIAVPHAPDPMIPICFICMFNTFYITNFKGINLYLGHCEGSVLSVRVSVSKHVRIVSIMFDFLSTSTE